MPCLSICPKLFWTVQIVLDENKLFWLGPNHFGQVQIIFFWTNFYNLDLSNMIWTRPKRIGPVQNNWYSTKMIWTVQNHSGPKYKSTRHKKWEIIFWSAKCKVWSSQFEMDVLHHALVFRFQFHVDHITKRKDFILVQVESESNRIKCSIV